EIVSDVRFADEDARIKHQGELFVLVDAWLQSFPSHEDAVAALERIGVAAAAVLDPWEAVSHPYFRSRDMVRDVVQSDQSVLPTIATPYRLSTTPIEVGKTPFLGENNEDVLQSLLGYDRPTIGDLTARGILYSERIPSAEVFGNDQGPQ